MTDDLDALRRRLYAPDVTAAEVARYRALAGGADTGSPEPPPDPPSAPEVPRRRGRRLLIAGLATAAVLALAGVGAVATSRPHPTPVPTPPAVRATLPVLSASDDSTVAVPPPVRAAFVAALRAGRSAGVLRYFYEHPDDLPAQLRTPRRADSDERFGSGTAVVLLSPSPAAEKGGRLTVGVTVDRVASVQLRAIRADSGMQSFIERLDDGAQRSIPGLPMVRTAVYDGEAPTVLELTVPKGVRWDVVAVFTD